MGFTEVVVGMAPPMWVHLLSRNVIGNRLSNYYIQTGSLVSDADKLVNQRFVDEVKSDDQVHGRAAELIHQYNTLPFIARADAKLKSNAHVLATFTPEALDKVVESIAGVEFQTRTTLIIEQMKERKK